MVSAVSSMELGIGKGNYFFDNFLAKDDQDAVAFKLPLQTDCTSLTIGNLSKYFPYSGHYQIRVHCGDRHGAPAGEYADAVTVVR
jgi:hypothetical protein